MSRCKCCEIELTPETETDFGEAPLYKPCSREAWRGFESAKSWQTEWPDGSANDRQWWWLYARCWGDAEPKLYSVNVWKIANGTAWVASGHFIFPQDVEGPPALWQRATLPELPSDEASELTAIRASGPCACGEVEIMVGRIATVTGVHTLQHCISHEGIEGLRKLGMISSSDADALSAIPWKSVTR